MDVTLEGTSICDRKSLEKPGAVILLRTPRKDQNNEECPCDNATPEYSARNHSERFGLDDSGRWR